MMGCLSEEHLQPNRSSRDVPVGGRRGPYPSRFWGVVRMLVAQQTRASSRAHSRPFISATAFVVGASMVGQDEASESR